MLISLINFFTLGFYAQPEALRFIFSPDDVLTCEGCGQVTLTCGIPRQQTAANVPEPELQWMFNSSTVRHFVDAVVGYKYFSMFDMIIYST